MNYKHLTGSELLKQTAHTAKSIRTQTLVLLDLLTEINGRKLFCEKGFGSLFSYIVEELKFSESQAAIYNHLVQSQVAELPQIKEKIECGALSLFAASQGAAVIRENKLETKEQKLEMMNSFVGLNKEESKQKHQELTAGLSQAKTTQKMIINPSLQKKLEAFKKQRKLPMSTKPEDILNMLLDESLQEDKEIRETNKTLTPKTKKSIRIAAGHRCEYVSPDGKRCSETSRLEIDHIRPRALGGNHARSNLRCYCRAHNQWAAMEQMGCHIIGKRREWTSPAKETLRTQRQPQKSNYKKVIARKSRF